MVRRLMFAAAAAIGLSGCVSLSAVSLTQIPKERRKVVSAESSRIVVLGLNFDNEWVNTVSRRLSDQREGGQVRGILTKQEVTDYFLMIVHKRSVSAKGYCVRG